jgi:hypothetical protein
LVRKVKHGFNKIFDRVEASKQRLFRSAGLIYVALFMRQSGMTGIIEERIHIDMDQSVSGQYAT